MAEHGMNVNYNNMRLQAAYAFDRLCKKLNSAIEGNGNLCMHKDDIQKEMDDMRIFALMPCFTFVEGDPEHIDLTDKVGDIASYNPDRADYCKENGIDLGGE